MDQPTSETDGSDEGVGRENGVATLWAGDTVRGPVDPPDAHRSIQHLALIYENQDEQFAAAIPFIRQGLQRNERCLYVTHEHSPVEIREAMEAAGIDVDTALSSGALTIQPAQDMYYRDGVFDPNEVLSDFSEIIDEALEGYEGVRVTSEMSWVLDAESPVEDLIKYEAEVNRLHTDNECIGLCQYNRNRFPTEIIHDIIETHPHVITENAVSLNLYYTLPDAFFVSQQLAPDIDQILATVRDRTAARMGLQERERYLRELTEIIAGPSQSFEEKLQALFELGCNWFGFELGAMARVDPRTDRFEVEYTSAEHDHFEPGLELPLSETFCAAATDSEGTASVITPAEEGYEDIAVYRTFGLKAYLGTAIEVDGDDNRTFFFVSGEPQDEPVPDEQHTFLRLMGQWVKSELERKQREDRLAALSTLSRTVLDAETVTDVSECVVEVAETLGLPMLAIALYDEQANVLRLTAQTDVAAKVLEATSLLEVGDSIGWEAFNNNELQCKTIPIGNQFAERPPVTELVAHPLGDRGVVLTGTCTTEGFGASDRDFVETVAGTITAALERAQRDQQVQEREATLEAQNEVLERTNRINALVQELIQALVEEPTRTEIEQTVCARLAASDFYQGAWIGDRPLPSQEVTPRVWNGTEEAAVTAMTATGTETGSAQGIVERAVDTQEVQVIQNIADNPAVEGCRDELQTHGIESALAVPIPYKDTSYGVLVVTATQPGAFSERQQTIFRKFGTTLGFAITAAERKQALISDEVVELDVCVRDPGHFFVRATAETDATFTLDGLTTEDDQSCVVYVAMTGAPAEQIIDLAEQSDAIEHARLVENRGDEARLEFIYTGSTVVDTFAEYGATVTAATATDGEAMVEVELPPTADVRSVVEAFQATFPDSEVVAKRTVDESNLTKERFQTALTERLTDKQLTALQTAYFAGYFDRPRISSGDEIAATLGVSPSTFHQHLRVAERKLTEAFVTN